LRSGESRLGLYLHRRALAGDCNPLLEVLASRPRKLQRVRLDQRRRIPPALDARDDRELVDQVLQLDGSRFDHLDVAGRRLVEIRLPQRLGEPVDGCERRREVVRADRDDASEAFGLGHFPPWYG
jgi:hypothetical protein